MDFGSMADKAKDWAGQNPDKADSYVEKGEDFADSRFGGHEAQVDQAGQKAKDFLHGGQEQPPAGEAGEPGEQAPPPPPPGEEPPRP